MLPSLGTVTLCQTHAGSSQSERASAPFCSNLKYTFMLLQVAKSMFLKMLEQPLAMAIPNPSQMSPSFIVPAMKEAHDATIYARRLVAIRNVYHLGPRPFEELVFVLEIPQHSAALPVPVGLRSV